MIKKKNWILLAIFILGTNTVAYSKDTQQNIPSSTTRLHVKNVQTYTHPKQQMTVLRASFDLPTGHWEIDNYDSLTGLKHIQLGLPDGHQPMRGSRYLEIENQKVKPHISSLYRRINTYALKNADYTLTLNDFNSQKQKVFELIKNVTGELGINSPSINTVREAIDWLNESIAPYKIYIKYMEGNHGYPYQYWVMNDIKQQYSIKEIEQLTESDLKKLVQTSLGKQLKRIILTQRYKLKALNSVPDNIYGPASINDMDKGLHTMFYRQSIDYPIKLSQESKNLHYFLIPNVKLLTRKDEKNEPLVLELHPYIDDGKHWVLFSSGKSERVDINQDLLNKYGIKVEPVVSKTEDDLQTFHLTALLLPGAQGPWALILKKAGSSETVELNLSLDQVSTGNQELFNEWINERAYSWAKMFSIAPSTIYQTWLKRFTSIYDLENSKEFSSFNQPRRAGRTSSMFNLLGGRAAIEETLQMINLNVDNSNKQSSEPMTPIDQIEGVKVKGHPYQKMLAGQKGGRLTFADYVPHDRFFMYFSKPSELASYLENGVSFMHQFGSDIIGNNIQYDLKERYYARLGLNTAWVEQFLKSNFVKEVAFILPDLFFIDGTDMTIVLDIPNLGLIAPLLKLVGISDLIQDQIIEKTVDNNSNSYWVMHEQLLVISTNKKEITNVLNLMKNRGKGSLGQSAEFSFMLTKMPVKEETNIYAYFSDPFIRRMVGPEIKIAQYRRLKERANLEAITAGALLYQSDGHTDVPTINGLVQKGYVSKNFLSSEYQLDENLRVHSKQFGTTSNLSTILDMSLTSVFANEAKAYKEYVDNYSRFWRQFFDPIAIRFDKKASDESEINVFILPLIDSSIYEGARAVLNGLDAGKELIHPTFTPKPVATISANINENTWIEIVKIFGFLQNYTNLNPDIFDEFGPSMHIVVLDADPIINLGSGDFLGLLGTGGNQILRGQESLWMPIAFMLFTRPTKIMFELKNSEKVLTHLRNMSSLKDSDFRRNWTESRVEFTQLNGQDEWICRISLFGFLKLRFGIKIQDDFLVFSNVPWSGQHKADFSNKEHLNSAAVSINPGAAKLQLPGLHNTALEGMADANRHNMVYLTPFTLLNEQDIEKTLLQHKQLFGFTPLHFGEGQWSWENGHLQSTTFGSLWSKRQPSYKVNDRNFGLFRKFHNLSVSMQFEDEGLRTKIRWKSQN